ncbi:MAG: aminoglycoside phosphotransferase family protein, partial [Planctomycetota bacterium]
MSDRDDNHRPWHGLHRPDARTVEAVLSDQCPHVLAGPVRAFSEGWDFTAFDVGDTFLARFPKRDDVPRTIPQERRVLDALASAGQSLVPTDRFYGEASDLFPLPFTVHRKVPGAPLDELGLRDVGPGAAGRVGAAVGALLRAVHALPLSLVGEPEDDAEGMDRWLFEAREILARIRPELPTAAVRRTSERLSSEAETPDRVVTHGDLGPEHIL